MKTLFSTKYIETKIAMGCHTIEFHQGKAEVEDVVADEILKAGYANVFAELPQQKSSRETLLTGTFDVERKTLQEEIARIQGINESRQKTIENLERELSNWKEEYEKLVQSKEEDLISRGFVKKEEGSEDETRKQFESFTKDDIVTLLAQKMPDFDPAKVRTMKKDELIDYAIANVKL